MLQWKVLADNIKIAVVVYQQGTVFDGEMGNTAIDRAAHGQTALAQEKIDPGRLRPGRCLSFQIILTNEIIMQPIPFVLITTTLQ